MLANFGYLFPGSNQNDIETFQEANKAKDAISNLSRSELVWIAPNKWLKHLGSDIVFMICVEIFFKNVL